MQCLPTFLFCSQFPHFFFGGWILSSFVVEVEISDWTRFIILGFQLPFEASEVIHHGGVACDLWDAWIFLRGLDVNHGFLGIKLLVV